MDDEIRKLEQLAAIGDSDAIERLRQLKKRSTSKPKKFYYCLTWQDIFKALNFNYTSIEESLLERFANVADDAANHYYEDADEDDEIESKKENLKYAVEAFCMEKFYKDCLAATISELDTIVSDINRWGKKGMQSAIYDRPERHRSGLAVEMVELNNTSLEDPAVCFQLYRPFLLVHAEGLAGAAGFHDEGRGLSQMEGTDVIAAGTWIAQCEGTKIPAKRLREQVSQIDFEPSYHDMRQIVKSMEDESTS